MVQIMYMEINACYTVTQVHLTTFMKYTVQQMMFMLVDNVYCNANNVSGNQMYISQGGMCILPHEG